MNGRDNRTLIGLVKEIDVSGWGPNSAQLEFSIIPPQGEAQTFVIEFDTVPQVFATAATILVNAYQTRANVQVTISNGQPGNQTPKISGVKVPGFPQS